MKRWADRDRRALTALFVGWHALLLAAMIPPQALDRLPSTAAGVVRATRRGLAHLGMRPGHFVFPGRAPTSGLPFARQACCVQLNVVSSDGRQVHHQFPPRCAPPPARGLGRQPHDYLRQGLCRSRLFTTGWHHFPPQPAAIGSAVRFACSLATDATSTEVVELARWMDLRDGTLHDRALHHGTFDCPREAP